MSAKSEQGSWVIAIYKEISEYNLDHLSFDPLEAIITAGRAADLFSATRALGTVAGDTFDKYRKIAHLKPATAKAVLQLAEAAGHISVHRDSGGHVQEYRFLEDSKLSLIHI